MLSRLVYAKLHGSCNGKFYQRSHKFNHTFTQIAILNIYKYILLSRHVDITKHYFLLSFETMPHLK